MNQNIVSVPLNENVFCYYSSVASDACANKSRNLPYSACVPTFNRWLCIFNVHYSLFSILSQFLNVFRSKKRQWLSNYPFQKGYFIQ